MAKILVVEDDYALARLVEAYLIQAGHTVLRAETGEEALALWEQEKPDALILDLMLPGMSGEEVCRQIRARSAVPILMLTAKESEDDRVAGFRLGADDYVVKPFLPRELVARVEALLRRAHGEWGYPPPPQPGPFPSRSQRPTGLGERRGGLPDPHRVPAAGDPPGTVGSSGAP